MPKVWVPVFPRVVRKFTIGESPKISMKISMQIKINLKIYCEHSLKMQIFKKICLLSVRYGKLRNIRSKVYNWNSHDRDPRTKKNLQKLIEIGHGKNYIPLIIPKFHELFLFRKKYVIQK